MESSPPPDEPAEISPAELERGERVCRNIWVVSTMALITPLAWVPGAILGGILATSFGQYLPRDSNGLEFCFATVVALVVAAGVARLGLWRDWHLRATLLRNWSIVAAAVLALTVWAGVASRKASQLGKDKSVMSSLRILSAATEQRFLEFPDRMFLTYDEIVGPTRYVKWLEPVEGEDLHALFPIRRGRPEDFRNWIIKLPDGRIISYPEANIPKPDGVDVIKLPDGGRLETIYRGGVADGPFRAYYPDGKLWSETTYANGRVAGPCWLYTRDGKKFDELKDSEAIERAQAGK